MQNFNSLIASSLDKYFESLKFTGFQSDAKVNSLLTLLGINYLISNFAEFITEEDQIAINNLLSCITGTCLIDYPEFESQNSLFEQVYRDKLIADLIKCKSL